jgi:hypothetical protein
MSAPMAGVASAVIHGFTTNSRDEVGPMAIVPGVAVEAHEVGSTGWWIVTAYEGRCASSPMPLWDVAEVVEPAEGGNLY